MALEKHISVEGFAPPSASHPSGLRFPEIELAAAKVLASNSDCRATITNTWECMAELHVITADGTRLCRLFNYNDVAMAEEPEKWWEDAIRCELEEIKPR